MVIPSLNAQLFSDGRGVQFKQLEACKYLANGMKCDSCFRLTDTSGKLNRCVPLDSLKKIFQGSITVGIVNAPNCSYAIVLNGVPQDTFGYYLTQLTDTSFTINDYDGTACDTISIPFSNLTSNYLNQFFDEYVINYFDTSTFNCSWIQECIGNASLNCDSVLACVPCDYIEACIVSDCSGVESCIDCAYLESLNCPQLEWNCDKTKQCIDCTYLESLNCPQLEWSCAKTVACIDCQVLEDLNCPELEWNCTKTKQCIDCTYLEGLNCPQLEWNCSKTLDCIDCAFLESLGCFETDPLNCDTVQACIDCAFLQSLNCPQLETPFTCDSVRACETNTFITGGCPYVFHNEDGTLFNFGHKLSISGQTLSITDWNNNTCNSVTLPTGSVYNCDSVRNCITCDWLQSLNCPQLETPFNCDSVRACETTTNITGNGCPYTYTNEDGVSTNFGYTLAINAGMIELRSVTVNTLCSSVSLPVGENWNCDSVRLCETNTSVVEDGCNYKHINEDGVPSFFGYGLTATITLRASI